MKHTKGLKQSLESQKIHEPVLLGFKKEKNCAFQNLVN